MSGNNYENLIDELYFKCFPNFDLSRKRRTEIVCCILNFYTQSNMYADFNECIRIIKNGEIVFEMAADCEMSDILSFERILCGFLQNEILIIKLNVLSNT